MVGTLAGNIGIVNMSLVYIRYGFKHHIWLANNTQHLITKVHLAVGINYRSEQLPSASTAVHTQHAKDLQEPQTPDS